MLKFERGLNAVIRYAAIVAAYALGVMMLLTVADVGGRFLFTKPVSGASEIVGYMLLVAGTWGLAYAQTQKRHIRVTFLMEHFSERKHQIINVLADILGLCAFVLITWQSYVLFLHNWIDRSDNYVLNVRVAPFVMLIVVGVALFSIRLFIDVIHDITSFFADPKIKVTINPETPPSAL